jgi:hypothetical protein
VDNEQREFHVKEFEKLDALRLDHAKLSAKVDFVETELRASKQENNNRFERLEKKIDNLHNLFTEVTSDVKVMATKIAGGAVAAGLVLQVILKHFGLV